MKLLGFLFSFLYLTKLLVQKGEFEKKANNGAQRLLFTEVTLHGIILQNDLIVSMTCKGANSLFDPIQYVGQERRLNRRAVKELSNFYSSVPRAKWYNLAP